MGYKIFIKLSLPNATENEREIFCESLVNENWSRITALPTEWKASFEEDVTRERAIKIMHNDLLRAKNESKVKKVEYAMQITHQCALYTTHCAI